MGKSMKLTDRPSLPHGLAFWGATRWTSGIKSPGDPSFDPFWRALYAARVHLALGGDVHNYEPFAKQTPAGVAARDVFDSSS